MKSGDTSRRDTLRFVLAAIQREGVDRLQAAIERLIAEGKNEASRQTYIAEHRPSDLDDVAVLDVLQKQAKMRRDSIDAFRKGDRPQLAAKEEQELAIIRQAIAELNPTCRQVFILHRFGNATYGQIAERLGVSVSMIEKHVSAALAHLKSRLDNVS